MADKIKILIVDDHPVVREGLCTLISSEDDLEVMATASDGIEGVEKALTLSPDVVLMDLIMPRKDGIQAISDIIEGNPEARILVLSSFGENQKVLQSIQVGASGYILKTSTPEELLEAIRKVYNKQPAMHPDVLARLMKDLKQRPEKAETVSLEVLTEREIEILKIVARGLSNHDIAGQLNISERTVTKHVSNILGKLNLANRTQAAFYAVQTGLINTESE